MFNQQVISTINRKEEEKSMFKKTLAVLLTALMSALVLFAHGDAEHVLGTISAVQGDHVTVKLQDGKTETMVMLGKDTKFFNGDKKARKEDVKVGLRVVIDAKMDTKMKMLLAEEVKLGVTATHDDHKK
jgi:hypothetical protein